MMHSHTDDKIRPTISYTGPDGSIAEIIYDAKAQRTSLATRAANGDIAVRDDFTPSENEVLHPYSPQNGLIAQGCVLLPSDVGDERDKADLIAAIRVFLHRYVALPPEFELIAAYYVLMSWVYDAFEVVPYLRARGDYGTGKTRALLAIGSLCYKPFFASGASTVSPIFHILDAFRGTLILDEADFRFSDATSELTKILNNGNARGMPVLRTMTNRHRELHPQAFRVFGPKVIGMREGFADQALESRCITVDMGAEPLRTEIPIQLPRTFEDDARNLRNLLLGFRLRRLHTITLDVTAKATGLDGRGNQTALPLLSLIDDDSQRNSVVAYLELEQERRQQDRSDTTEALLLSAVVDAFAWTRTEYVTLGEVAERFNRVGCSELGKQVSNRWVARVLRNQLHIRTKKTRGVYAIPLTEKPKIDTLAVRYGVEGGSQEA